MATKTFYLLSTAAVAPNYFGNVQDSVAPGALTSAFGFYPGFTASSSPYMKAQIGATAPSQTFSINSNIDTSPGPRAVGASADSWRTPARLVGSFAAGTWTFVFGIIANTPTSTGYIRARMWASVNADGSAARDLVGGTFIGNTVTTSAAGTVYYSQWTWAPNWVITLNNEYLFFQIEWYAAANSTAQFSDVRFSQGATYVTTPDYAPVVPTGAHIAAMA